MAQPGANKLRIRELKGKLEDAVDDLGSYGAVIMWEEMHSLEEKLKWELFLKVQADYTYRELCDLLEKR